MLKAVSIENMSVDELADMFIDRIMDGTLVKMAEPTLEQTPCCRQSGIMNLQSKIEEHMNEDFDRQLIRIMIEP